MVTLISSGSPPTLEELNRAKEEFGDYVKVVVDLLTGRYSLGGQLHADGEKMLLENGSKQLDLWGGGVDLLTGGVEANALINLRSPNGNQEILDPVIRTSFINFIKDYFKEYV